ncbi:MAG: hypothetical protein U1F43_20685 [Myxococcota bacterium]
MRTVMPIIGLVLAASACDDGLPSATKVTGFRVLAVRAEPPEVAPGDSVALDALMVDPSGAVPDSIKWYACIVADTGTGFFGGSSETQTSGGDGTPLPTDGYGGSCEKRALAHEPFTLELGEGPTATLPVPADLFDTDAALKAAYGLADDITIPAEVSAGLLGIAGVNYTVSMVTDIGGEHLETMKRVNVSLDSLLPDNERNLNPVDLTLHIAAVADHVTPQAHTDPASGGHCFLDPSFVVAPDGRYRLTPVNVPDPQASYVVLLAGSTSSGQAFDLQTIQETYFYSFFSTVGGLSKEISKAPGEPACDWHIPADATGPVDLWVVVRDGRGGVAWCHEALAVAPAATP